MFSDFADVALRNPDQGGAPYTPEMYEAVLNADNSHRIAYYLGKNPQLAQSLCEMTPAKAVMEIGKLDIKLAQTQTKKISTAPEPIKPLESVNAETVDLYDPNLSMEDFAKRWKAERAK